MPQIINKQLELVTIRVKAGAEWRGVKHVEPKLYNLSAEYAKHVVETLGIAEYVQVDGQGNFQE